LMPRYGFSESRLRGTPRLVHGLRHGTVPCSSWVVCFRWVRVTIA
jgi:hypothetical protein